MTDTILNSLEVASFRGAEFLYSAGSVSAGRKTVVFEYPNKSFRVVEDLGGLLKTFQITGIITGRDFEYFERRSNLINELERESDGELIHPFFGRINVTPQTYTVSESPSTLGVATFTMTFLQSRPASLPTLSQDNSARINQLSADLFDQISAEISAKWFVTQGFINNVQNAINLLNDINRFISLTPQLFPGLVGTLSQFFDALNVFKDLTPRLVDSPEELSTQLTDLYLQADSLGTSAIDRVRIANNLFNFDSRFDEIRTTTAGLTERRRDTKLLDLAVNSMALSNAYRSIPQIEFETQDEIDLVTKALEGQYRSIIQKNEDLTLEKDTIRTIAAMRNEVRLYFDRQGTTTSKIITVNTKRTTLKELVYRYYGDLDNLDTVQNLNNFAAPRFIEGDVKILSI